MKTREEVVRRALHKLGVVGAGQAPDADDAALVDNSIGPVLADLATRGIYAWGDPDNTDDDAFEHLATIIANTVARDFGVDENETVRLAAESRLRQLDVAVLSGRPQPVEYF